MQGKIYRIVKILGRMNSRTVMMERFQDAEFSWHCCPQKTVRSVCVLYLLFTQPSPIRSFHSSDPSFSVSCPKGGGYAMVYCTLCYQFDIASRCWLSVRRHYWMGVVRISRQLRRSVRSRDRGGLDEPF